MYDYKELRVIKLKAKFYSKELWGKEYDLPISINNRLKKTLARLMYDWEGDPERIEFAGELIKERYLELTLDSILVHELCHWYRDLKRMVNDDDDPRFIDFVKKHGGSLSGEYNGHVGPVHISKCNKCGNKVWTSSKMSIDKLQYVVSRCCDSSITYECEDYAEDTYKPRQKIIELNTKFKEYYAESKIA